MIQWTARGKTIADTAHPRVMGIVNATPDSFSDGGLAFQTAAAIKRGITLVNEGATILDIGGESSRPGAAIVSLDEELRRVIPVIEGLAAKVSQAISIDTNKPEVARRALQAGATIVNDIDAVVSDAMAEVIAEFQAGVCLMHKQGTPQTMQLDPRYDDVVREVIDSLAASIERVEKFGIPRERISVDPGIGFGKTFEHNLTLLRNLERFASLGCIVLVGISRKGLLRTLTNRDVSARTTGSVVSSLLSIEKGARVVRVHDVGPMVDAIKVWSAIENWDGRHDG